MSKVWFITGTSKGFGRVWAEAALERGDKVVATARRQDSVSDLADSYGEDNVLALALDVQDRSAIADAVKQAQEKFGRIDVAVNNAGYGLFGAVEEVSEEQARDQIETNLFGALWVTQAVLPIMREQGSGHIIQVSSVGGVAAFINVGLYHASKWGLEGFSQSLAQEVADFGIHVTLVEPGGFGTDWSGASAVRAEEMEAYDGMREADKKRRSGAKPGDPDATGPAILKVVDAEEPPLRVFFGEAPLGVIEKEYESRLEEWREWDSVSKEAQGSGS